VPLVFDSRLAAAETLDCRAAPEDPYEACIPGGVNVLFQGLWTDPSTGIAYARNRWLESRTASWLSEDPLGAVDSPNLYAFVGWGPQAGADPMGSQQGDGEGCFNLFGKYICLPWVREPPKKPAPQPKVSAEQFADPQIYEMAWQELEEHPDMVFIAILGPVALEEGIGGGALLEGELGGGALEESLPVARRGLAADGTMQIGLARARALSGLPPVEVGAETAGVNASGSGLPPVRMAGEGAASGGGAIVVYDAETAAGNLRLAGSIDDAIAIENSFGLWERPSGFRASARSSAIAPFTDNGVVICAGCGGATEPTITVLTRSGPMTRIGYDLDHAGIIWADRVRILQTLRAPVSRSFVLDVYNQNLRPLHPLPCNQGHLYEPPRMVLPGDD
jgi:RHS repeat-associated protein